MKRECVDQPFCVFLPVMRKYKFIIYERARKQTNQQTHLASYNYSYPEVVTVEGLYENPSKAEGSVRAFPSKVGVTAGTSRRKS